MVYDYIIVGQGVAGTLLCHHLLKRNKSVCVIDPEIQNATQVAAGNINPITGRSYTKTWMLEELLEEVKSSYSDIEKEINLPILSSLEIYRTLRTIKDENKWMGRVENPAYSRYIGEANKVPELDGVLLKPLSYGKITGGYQVNTQNLIKGYRNFLKKNKNFINEKMDYDKLEFFNGLVDYEGIKAKRIVFAEGYQVANNPFFTNIHIEPTRGDVLIIDIEAELKLSLRDQTLITPFREHYWVGSNYDKNFISDKPTEKGKDFLRKKLDGFLLPKYQIIDHLSGVRPCTYNRRPILGQSETNENVYIFNGLGTKGTSLAPYFAKQMSNYLIDGVELMKEVDIKRFKN